MGETITRDRNFTNFLQRFSPDSRWHSMNAPASVAELYTRWSVRNPPPKAAPGLPVVTTGDIFISYASDDIGAAERLFKDLDLIGGDVVWFDKSNLRPGDDWSKELMSAVQRCSFFLPLISATTERRAEGYFRREWYEAEERFKKRSRADKFIFPIVIDPDYDGNMDRYKRVPDAFKERQFAGAPAGQMPDALKAELSLHLRDLRRARGV